MADFRKAEDQVATLQERIIPALSAVGTVFILGWVLWYTGRANEGLPWLRAAAVMRPDNPWVHFYLGNANLALGEYGEAHRMYAKALQLRSDHSSAQAGVIWSLLPTIKSVAHCALSMAASPVL